MNRIFITPMVLMVSSVALTTNIVALTVPGNNFGTELLKITPTDASEYDQFGYSVAIDAGLAIVGALEAAGDGSVGFGSAYVYSVNDGTQLREIIANDGSVGDRFGTSVALNGTTALVGAYRARVNNEITGAAYLFDASAGTQIHKLVGNDTVGADEFGRAVALDGSLAIVGARRDDSPQVDRGSAYVFNVSTGQQLFKLTAADGARGDQFGQSVDIDDNLAVVGAYLDDGGLGSVYVFDTTTGVQLRRLLPDDSLGRIQFGISIAIDNGLVLVGARGHNPDDVNTGVAYLFDAKTGIQLAEFFAPDGSNFDNFGRNVAMDGGIAIISAIEDDNFGSQSGSAYLFDVNTKQLLAKINASDAEAEDNFGWEVGIDGSPAGGGRAIVASRFGDQNRIGTGSAYIYDVQRVPEASSYLLLGMFVFLLCCYRSTSNVN